MANEETYPILDQWYDLPDLRSMIFIMKMLRVIASVDLDFSFIHVYMDCCCTMPKKCGWFTNELVIIKWNGLNLLGNTCIIISC